MPRRTSALLAVVLPVALFAVLDSALVLHFRGLERRYLPSPLGWIALTEIAAAVVLGLVSRRTRSAGAVLAVGTGLAVALPVAAVAVTGLLPRFAPLAPAPAVGWAAALGVAAALASLWTTRRAHRTPGRPPDLAPARWLEPVATLIALAGPWAVLLASGVRPGSRRGLALWAAGATGVLAAAIVSRRVAGTRAVRALHITGSASLSAVILAAIAATWCGERPLPAVPPLAADRPGAPPDVLLVVLDTTRADFAPAPTGSAFPTPALARLAGQGARFGSAFAPSCWTVPGHASLFLGLPAGEHGVGWTSPYLRYSAPTLAERFAAAGYRTAGFSANPWITPEFEFDRGFERFQTADLERRPRLPLLLALWPPLAERLETGFLWADKDGFVLASEALRELQKPGPSFVFLNLMEAHLPYQPPGRVLRRHGVDRRREKELRAVGQEPLADLAAGASPRRPEEVDALRTLYSAEVAYADWLLGRIVDRLAEAGRLDRTVVAITSDHGENLGDHAPLDHQLGLYDTLIHVPLLLRYPSRIPEGQAIDDLVALEDLGSALLRLAGAAQVEGENAAPGAMPGPLGLFPARDSVRLDYDRPVPVLERLRDRLHVDPAPWDRTLWGLRAVDAKWIEASDGRHQGFDLVADPWEKTSLAESAGELPAPVAALAARVRAGPRPPPVRPTEPPPDEALPRLRSLGYVR